MSDFRNFLNKQLENPDFKKEWTASESEYTLIRALVAARKEKHITQKQLSELTGIDQADISKIETGNANPKLSTLQRLADAMDMVLKFELVPKQA